MYVRAMTIETHTALILNSCYLTSRSFYAQLIPQIVQTELKYMSAATVLMLRSLKPLVEKPRWKRDKLTIHAGLAMENRVTNFPL